MLGTIVNTGLIITLFAIAAPFIFVLLVIRMTIGRDKKRTADEDTKNSEDLDEIAKGLRDLNRRIDNLETLNKNKQDKER
ncbi:MAG: hypothetical protein PQJ61_03110 [Spirochaetales bacterium]|uniref:Uncharacterized protein n=1 Tax=Candidatus Thalassospirochaeta sargassi TaxID=3119039 RepID=A0AAJ1MIP3_9SPIO|nr:hypothetical protein [Spirochaetales bacterium]